MAKTRTSTSRQVGTSRPVSSRGPSEKPERELLSFIPEKFRSLTWIALIFLTLMIFFGGVIFGGEYFAANDNISWESYRPYLNQMAEKGESPQWMPYIFSGMPGVAAYMVTGERQWDISAWVLNQTATVFSVANTDVMRVLFYYLLLGIGVFLLMRSKGITRPIAFFSSFAVLFSTWIIVWIMIGHNTKPMTLAFIPWTILFLDKLIDRWSLLYAGLLILAVHFILESAHPQTAFYGACLIGIWLAVEFIASLIRGGSTRTLGIGRAALIGLVAAGFAYGMGKDRINAALEYNDYSTRGPASIIDTTSNEQDAVKQYEYATNWSFGVGQTFTYVVPSYFGFGKLKLEGFTNGTQPTTWGNAKEPFTDAAHYMGILVLLLGFYGAWHFRKKPFVVGMFAAGAFGLLLSYGGNLSWLYDIFYAIVPKFKQFRAPSQSLVILEFAFPLLAGFGLQALVNRRKERVGAEETAKRFRIGAMAAGAFLLLLFGIKGTYLSTVASQPQFQGNMQVAEAMFSYTATDWAFTAIIAAIFCLLAWAYLSRKISGTILLVSAIGLTLIDLWHIDYRAMLDNVPKQQAFAVFNKTDIDQFLDQDTTQYRIADVRQGGNFHPNFPAYHFHQNIAGYSAAKMRRYQDLMDVTAEGSTSMPGPGLAWDILNAKYIIASQPIGEGFKQVFASQNGAGFVFENPKGMPRAWFVDRVETAKDLDVLTKIKENGFNPWEVAYVADPLEAKIDSPAPAGAAAPTAGTDSTNAADSTALAPATDYAARERMVKITDWEAHHITMEVEATGTNFLVVSEIFYPPGWHATIDGKPVETIRTNYLLRGLVVPPGKHEIRYEYLDEAFESGKTLSLILNLIMLGAIGAGIVLERRKKSANAATPEPNETADESGTEEEETA